MKRDLEVIYKYGKPTNNLRFMNGALEQLYELRETYSSGETFIREWVPVVGQKEA